MEQYVIGIDVGGTKVAYGFFDKKKNILFRQRHPSSVALSPEAFFDNIALNIDRILKENHLSKSQLSGIGLGVPSYVDENGYILKTSNLSKLKEFDARSFLLKKLGDTVRIALDNDSHAGALAEHRYGAGKGYQNMLYCPVSTGIASAIIIDGKLFRGDYGWAGESGHMIITPGEGIECGCGNRGCLMSWCSGGMIVRHIQKWLSQGEQSCMPQLAGSSEAITTYHLCEAFRMGDTMAIKAVDQMVKYMSVWLYNLYVLLNITCFVFGGGLLQMGDILF